MKKRLLFCCVLLLTFKTCFAQSQIPASKLDEFRKFMQSQMKSDQIPGMTIGYISWNKSDETLWVEGFGYSDLENNVVAKAETAYRLGSISKMMTAAAVLQLMEQDKINL
ncbi:MAG TPA: serine hydrolase domain-containing protein, partial [Acidobacteriota bacterium]